MNRDTAKRGFERVKTDQLRLVCGSASFARKQNSNIAEFDVKPRNEGSFGAAGRDER
jgi:N-acetylglutamate synthase-like GNAT family acetyltransferase